MFFKYVLLNTNQIITKFLYNNNKNLIVCVNNNFFYYTILHIKLSSLFYSTQLIDIFAYELPNNKNNSITTSLLSKSPTILVYNFHSIINNQRFFIFVNKSFLIKNKTETKSITELFLNANWLEREISELHEIFFLGKKDTRNLLLQYGDTSSPMKKSFPSIGLREIFYDSISDTLVQTPVSLQF